MAISSNVIFKSSNLMRSLRHKGLFLQRIEHFFGWKYCTRYGMEVPKAGWVVSKAILMYFQLNNLALVVWNVIPNNRSTNFYRSATLRCLLIFFYFAFIKQVITCLFYHLFSVFSHKHYNVKNVGIQTLAPLYVSLLPLPLPTPSLSHLRMPKPINKFLNFAELFFQPSIIPGKWWERELGEFRNF